MGWMDMRASGGLMHLTSLSSPHGIGTMGKEARAFADFLHILKPRRLQRLQHRPAVVCGKLRRTDIPGAVFLIDPLVDPVALILHSGRIGMVAEDGVEIKKYSTFPCRRQLSSVIL